MKNIFRIAWRDFMAIASTKVFWIAMAMSPLIGLGFSYFANTVNDSQPTRHFVVIDQTGRYVEALQQTVDLRELRSVMPRLRDHYNQYKDFDKGSDASHEQIQQWLSNFHGTDQSIVAAEIRESGGPNQFRHLVLALVSDQAPDIELPKPRYRIVDLPSDINPNQYDLSQDKQSFIDAVRPYLLGERKLQDGDQWIDLYGATIIIEGNSNPYIGYWSKYLSNNSVSNFIRTNINKTVETERLLANGIDPQVLREVRSSQVDIERFDINKVTDSKENAVDQVLRYLPIIFAGVLLVVIMINIGLLLQSIIEEKSNRLLEVLLSSVSPLQLMLGKLTGVAAVTTMTLFSWLMIISTFIFFSVDASDIAGELASAQIPEQAQMEMQAQLEDVAINDVIQAAKEISIAVAKLFPVFVFYLICGYLIYASLILALGSLCSSQQEANNLTFPIILSLMVPMAITPFVINDPNGTLATVFTWIPIFTPVVILARFDSDLPMSDLLGSTALMLVTVALSLWVSVKIFRYGALHAQQPPKFMTLIKLLVQREK